MYSDRHNIAGTITLGLLLYCTATQYYLYGMQLYYTFIIGHAICVHWLYKSLAFDQAVTIRACVNLTAQTGNECG